MGVKQLFDLLIVLFLFFLLFHVFFKFEDLQLFCFLNGTFSVFWIFGLMKKSNIGQIFNLKLETIKLSISSFRNKTIYFLHKLKL